MGDWREKVEAAHDMVSALCRREREWVMSIPARPDYDPDFVITNALIAAKKHIAVLEAECAEFQRRLDAVLNKLDNPYWVGLPYEPTIGAVRQIAAQCHDIAEGRGLAESQAGKPVSLGGGA